MPARTNDFRLTRVLALLFALFLFGCQPQASGPAGADDVSKISGTVALVGFSQPGAVGDLLAGNLPEMTEKATPADLAALDAVLAGNVSARLIVKDASQTRRCQELGTSRADPNSRESALKRLVAIGNCMQAQYVVAPQIIEWRELVAGQTPAAVKMDIYLVDVASGRLAGRSHFQEAQQPLTSNLLQMGRFFERGGRWISATELATEGVKQAVKELGL